MTLKTTIAVDRPVDVPKLWRFVLELLREPGDSPAITEESVEGVARKLETPTNYGLPAKAVLRHGLSELIPIVDPRDDSAARESLRTPFGNMAAVVLSFDTSYGYRASNGVGCEDLHAFLVSEVYDWVVRGSAARFAWQGEFSGQWFMGIAELHRLGDSRRGNWQRGAV